MTTLPPVRINDELSAFIRTLHPVLKKRVHAALHSIRKEPAGGKQLQDELEGYRSFRVGKFRIIYRQTALKAIEIVAVGPRRTIYEEAALLVIKERGIE